MFWVIIIFFLWLYCLNVCRRGDLHFARFCIGSIGTFFCLIIVLRPLIAVPLTELVAQVASTIGHWFHICQSYVGSSMLMVDRPSESIGLIVDFECSGLLEICVYTSLLWFFQIYNKKEKMLLSIFGVVFILIANVLRILLINFLLLYKGNEIYFFAHSIAGRILFYVMRAFLYFSVFTKSQIIRQKVGGFQYEEE